MTCDSSCCGRQALFCFPVSLFFCLDLWTACCVLLIHAACVDVNSVRMIFFLFFPQLLFTFALAFFFTPHYFLVVLLYFIFSRLFSSVCFCLQLPPSPPLHCSCVSLTLISPHFPPPNSSLTASLPFYFSLTASVYFCSLILIHPSVYPSNH